jgi:hypothetical protein
VTQSSPPVVIGLNAVILAVTDESPRILTVRRPDYPVNLGDDLRKDAASGDLSLDALPFGPLDPDSDRTLELGLRHLVDEQAGLAFGYVEQLYTFGDRNREPRERRGAPRVVSVAYLALVREQKPSGPGVAGWSACYDFLPWEDWRGGRPAVLERIVENALDRWVGSASDAREKRGRRERAEIAFGLAGSGWDGDRVLDRYELLYEIGLVEEAHRDRAQRLLARADVEPSSLAAFASELGPPLALDHRRILATALGRIRGKIRYRPVVFELLPPVFTLFQLQRVMEALAGVRLHKQNFRRLVETAGLVEGTGRLEAHTGGRPAELFRFRREVLRERRAPGVGLPGLPQSD